MTDINDLKEHEVPLQEAYSIIRENATAMKIVTAANNEVNKT